jgi:hypothetical protein
MTWIAESVRGISFGSYFGSPVPPEFMRPLVDRGTGVSFDVSGEAS